MKKVYKNLCHAMTNACKISAVMWKSNLRVVEFCAINNFSVSVHNLILLPNGTYFLDVPITTVNKEESSRIIRKVETNTFRIYEIDKTCSKV